jgi:hypothetical protein
VLAREVLDLGAQVFDGAGAWVGGGSHVCKI